MYIFELIFKVIKNFRQRSKNVSVPKEEEQYEEQRCEHVFLPVDSTKKILACTKCGFLVKADELKVKIEKDLPPDKF